MIIVKTYYKTCYDCGANLDPGEKCNCGGILQTEVDKTFDVVNKENDKRINDAWNNYYNR